MSSADDIQAMLDDVYGVAGVPATWTPAGGAAVGFTAMLGGGDQVGQFQSGGLAMNFAAVQIKARAAELAALAPGAQPAQGDAIALLDDAGATIAAYIVTAPPLRADPRRLEWTFDLAEG